MDRYYRTTHSEFSFAVLPRCAEVDSVGGGTMWAALAEGEQLPYVATNFRTLQIGFDKKS